MTVLPYMRQLAQDYYKKNYPQPSPVSAVPVSPVDFLQPVSIPPTPTDPINEGGIWIGTIEPDSPGEGWLFFNTNNNILYIYTDGNWQEVVSSTTGSLPEAPTDGGIYARRNSAWTSIYDGGAY